MHLGIFVEERRPGSSEAGSLQETLDLADAAEQWGLDGVWLGEIHFAPTRSVHSAPLVMASFLAARTRRLRIGTAVQVLPLANPLRIAEEAATVDHLSQGRFDFGVGRSSSPRSYDVLGIPFAESQARFEEALAIIRLAWKGEPFSYDGKFHRFDNVIVTPRPYQQPHPLIRVAANSPETFPLVGRLGLPIFVGLRDLSVDEVATHLEEYRRAWVEAGHPGRGDACLRIPVYAAGTERASMDEPREAALYFFRRHIDIVGAGIRGGSADRRRARLEQLKGLSYEDIVRTRMAFGTGPGLVDRLAGIREQLQLTGMIAELNAGGLFPLDRMQRTLRVLTHEVMPKLA